MFPKARTGNRQERHREEKTSVAEKRARRIINISAPRRQATGTHCELTGVWQSPSGASISLYEGQLFPSDAGQPCVWAYAGQPASKAHSGDTRWAAAEHHRL